ncbi:alternative ribosome rescue aminoacyl-tRNA hydrolase ArfB [Croceicoccus naphthovorans]|uniref:Peptide chain release factor 1 n=1 Tax=Croceicoccus naphthovorans TaxID=1348774 RepID=A0A0G3XJ85_9SPHN|nr:alternative ribosome rescue aminoacyl-tRNA hydrolase ArfB [Croceicoccus naphthovorans]AKM11252.1 peptide chain release factor 1 [Croceicoccus naphthovorans]MBB3989841.1 ribosome-associated protein [Croceicoccus naphthovorans]
MAETAEETIARAHGLAEERFIAASGPGGQNVNKVATAVQLRVNIYRLGLPPQVFHRLKALAGGRVAASGDLIIDARRFRTQEQNRADARDRLAELLAQAYVQPKKRAKSRVNRVGKTQRLKAKKARGDVKSKRGAVKSWD